MNQLAGNNAICVIQSVPPYNGENRCTTSADAQTELLCAAISASGLEHVKD